MPRDVTERQPITARLRLTARSRLLSPHLRALALQASSMRNVPLLLLLSSILFLEISPSSLRLLQLIYRHGDRLPVYSFPNDPHQQRWAIGGDFLTSKGEEQLFELGTFLRRRYDGFVPRRFDPLHIYVRSTGFDRTIQSARCKLAGLYRQAPNSSLAQELARLERLNVSIVSMPPDDDLMVRCKSLCPAFDQLWEQKQRSEEWQRLEAHYRDFMRLLELHSGVRDVDLMKAFSIADPVSCWVAHNLSFPKWMTPAIAARVLEIGALKHYLKFSTPGMQRLRGGPLVKQMLENMERRMREPNLRRGRRVYSYSAHDGTISAVMNYLRIFNFKKSPYGSCLIFELHERPQRHFFVKIFLRNSSAALPHFIPFPDCKAECPFEQFRAAASKNLPEDVRAECFPS